MSALPVPARAGASRCPYTVAELEDLYQRSPDAFRAASRELAGDYAYCLGYEDGPAHRGLQRDSGDGLPILADGSGEDAGNSANHEGAGQNVLFVGGNVRWCTLPTVGLDGDNIYVNRDFRVRAGVCRSDSVLAASDASPYQE